MHSPISRGTFGVEADVDSLPTKERISHCADANTFTEAIVQPPQLVKHLVPVEVGRDIGLRDIRHGASCHKWKHTRVNCRLSHLQKRSYAI